MTDAASTEAEPVRLLDARAAELALAPARRRILAMLEEPDSATGLAERMGIPRQRVNYHLRELERGGLIELAQERPKRGFLERLYRPSARAFVLDPDLIRESPREKVGSRDRFSSAYLLRVAARLVRDVAVLRQRAARAGRRLLTVTAETELRFRAPADAERFTAELAKAVAKLVGEHGARSGDGGRRFRVVLAVHPARREGART